MASSVKNQVFEMADPAPSEQLFLSRKRLKTKLNSDGMIDKLKMRICFRGDIHQASTEIDPYSPHTDSVTLRLFFAWCAKLGLVPDQLDFVMAYVQAKMRERVFVMFPRLLGSVLAREYTPLDRSTLAPEESPLRIRLQRQVSV